ncbi:MAG: DUF3180 domain-containing protein [Actinomycetota bacterium]|nr:DUF3180 domain-containing protein [Actinomycetota bacterium]
MTSRTPLAPTRPRDLLAVGLLAVVVGNVLTRLFYSQIPNLPIAAAVVLGLLGIVEIVGGYLLRGRIERRNGAPPVDALMAARALLVARASAFAGSAVAGLWVGLLVHTLPDSGSVTAAASDSVTGGIGLACALLLVGAGLWLERCCRAPDDPDRDPDERPE